MVEILSNYFRSVIVLSPDDLLASVYLCLNRIAPAFEGIELGVAETNLLKVLLFVSIIIHCLHNIIFIIAKVGTKQYII